MKIDNGIDVAVSELVDYWGTYEGQPGYKKYSHKTLIEDAIYGIGIALSDKYRFAGGFAEFKRDLLKYLVEQQET